MGLLSLIDDETYSTLVYAQTRISGATLGLLRRKKAAMARWLTSEREALEASATTHYGRPIRFAPIEFNGGMFQLMPDQDAWRVLFVERPT